MHGVPVEGGWVFFGLVIFIFGLVIVSGIIIKLTYKSMLGAHRVVCESTGEARKRAGFGALRRAAADRGNASPASGCLEAAEED